MSSSVHPALEAPRWAVRFYLRHLPWVLALMAVPATERFLGQLVERTAVTGVLAEVLTAAARVLLVVIAVQLGIRSDSAVGPLSRAVVSQRLDRFFATQWKPLLLQVLALSVAFLLLNLIPEHLVPALVEVGPMYWAVLLAVKNLTVIPLTLLWWVGLARHALTPHKVTKSRARVPDSS